MTILDETYTLSDGVGIPNLGLGTWFIDDDKAADAVRSAIEAGYRNIDTAQAYGRRHARPALDAPGVADASRAGCVRLVSACARPRRARPLARARRAARSPW